MGLSKQGEFMVTVFTKTNCPQCKFLKILLNNKHVDYEECGEEESIARGVMSFPQTEIDGKRMTYKETFDYFNKEHS
jgi:glutaredoxin